MSNLKSLRGERSFLCGQVALAIRDGFTGGSPLGKIELQLDRMEMGNPVRVFANQRVSSQGIWSFPGLGRNLDPAQSPHRFRVTVDSEFYASRDPIDFGVYAYTDTQPLRRSLIKAPASINLRPNDRYPYAKNIPVIRGRVLKATGEPAPGATVSGPKQESTRANEDGYFSLPIRLPPPGVWPPSETLLSVQAAADQATLRLSSVLGLREGSRIELAEDGGVVLSEDALPGQRELVINTTETISSRVDIVIDDRMLLPRERRHEVESFSAVDKKITLKSGLAKRVLRGTRVLSQSERLEVKRIDAINRIVVLTSDLKKPWQPGARLLNYAFTLDVGASDTAPTILVQFQSDVAVPDDFRFMEIQLT